MNKDQHPPLSLNDLLETSPQREHHLFERTVAQLQAGDAEGAEQSFRELGLSRPGDSALLPLHAAVALALKRNDEAVWVLDQALKLNPNDVSLWFNLGQALLLVQDWQRAHQAFSILLLLQPTNGEVYYRRSLASRGLERTDDADADVREALRLEPQHVEALLALAQMTGWPGLEQR